MFKLYKKGQFHMMIMKAHMFQPAHNLHLEAQLAAMSCERLQLFVDRQGTSSSTKLETTALEKRYIQKPNISSLILKSTKKLIYLGSSMSCELIHWHFFFATARPNVVLCHPAWVPRGWQTYCWHEQRTSRILI